MWSSPSPTPGRLAWEPHCRFALFLPSSCHPIENPSRIECRFVAGSLCGVLRRCSRLTIDVITNWLSEEVNRGRLGSVPVAVEAGSLSIVIATSFNYRFARRMNDPRALFILAHGSGESYPSPQSMRIDFLSNRLSQGYVPSTVRC